MKEKAIDLYSRMTNYDTIVFIFLWCDITKILGVKYKQVQEQNLQISDVGQIIKLFCIRLTKNYPINSLMPEKFPLSDGYGAYIMEQLWGKDYYICMFQ